MIPNPLPTSGTPTLICPECSSITPADPAALLLSCTLLSIPEITGKEYYIHYHMKQWPDILILFQEITEGTLKGNFMLSIHKDSTGRLLTPKECRKGYGDNLGFVIYPEDHDGQELVGSKGIVVGFKKILVFDSEFLEDILKEIKRWKGTDVDSIIFMDKKPGSKQAAFNEATECIEDLHAKPWLLEPIAMAMQDTCPDDSIEELINWIKQQLTDSNPSTKI